MLQLITGIADAIIKLCRDIKGVVEVMDEVIIGLETRYYRWAVDLSDAQPQHEC